jgi:hypothetical protein
MVSRKSIADKLFSNAALINNKIKKKAIQRMQFLLNKLKHKNKNVDGDLKYTQEDFDKS